MKRLLVIFLVTALLASSALGCAKQEDIKSEAGASKTYDFRLATVYAEGHPALAALDRAKAKIEEGTKGNVKISIYPSSQLGDYTLTYEDLMKGAIDMALIGIPSQYDPKLEMNFIPYLTTNYSDMANAFGKDSEFFREYYKVHDALGVKLMGLYVDGFIGFGLKELPDTYADPKAKKDLLIRCPSIEVYKLVTEDMGYNSTTIPYSDLYSAMQTGVCDGWIGGTPQLNYTAFKDVIKYYIPYNVFVENVGFFMSKKVYDTLPAEYQNIIEDAFMEEAIRSIADSEKNDMEAIQALKDYGVQIVDLSQNTLDEYSSMIKEVTWPKLEKNLGADTMKLLTE